jgi:uncharacterized protein (TIGR02300 family)
MADLGKKHECSECGAKFYDLGKPDPVCPRCGTAVSDGEEEPSPKNRRKRRTPAVTGKTRAEASENFSSSDGEDDDYAEEEDLEEDLEDEDLEDLEDDEDEDDEDEDEDED